MPIKKSQRPILAERTSNVDFVTDLMEHSRHGALVQAFVIEALTKYSAQVKTAGPAKFDNALMSGETWVGIADEITEKLNVRFAHVTR
jgi:hypothetical protein